MEEENKYEFCDKPFRTPQALAGLTRMKHPGSPKVEIGDQEYRPRRLLLLSRSSLPLTCYG